MKEEIEELKKEVQEINQDSFAMEILKDYKKQNKRQFIVILVLVICWISTVLLFAYYINTNGYEVITETADTGQGGNACVGDKCNNGEINYGKGN